MRLRSLSRRRPAWPANDGLPRLPFTACLACRLRPSWTGTTVCLACSRHLPSLPTTVRLACQLRCYMLGLPTTAIPACHSCLLCDSILGCSWPPQWPETALNHSGQSQVRSKAKQATRSASCSCPLVLPLSDASAIAKVAPRLGPFQQLVAHSSSSWSHVGSDKC